MKVVQTSFPAKGGNGLHYWHRLGFRVGFQEKIRSLVRIMRIDYTRNPYL